ncbi:MAG: cytochrome c3 family protein [Elusimicrobia bacterium]|nr:cytochrome c3 family protein [Elusimicrobiota bacterium]
MKKAKIAGLLIAICAITTGVQPLHAAIAGSKHDFRQTGGGFPITGVTEMCVTCHVPHRPLVNVPLWNHSISSYTYTLYNQNAEYASGNSAAYDASPSGLQNSKSRLCMSCHDGSVAVASSVKIQSASNNWILWDNGAAVANGSGTGNTGMKGSHPVAVNYATVQTANPTDYVAAASLVDVKLDAGKVQCTTCHNPHNKYNKMLVADNAGSALCLKCHIK